MNTAQALQLLISLLNQGAALGALIRKAQQEGRDITAFELDQLAEGDDAARARLQAAIDGM